MARLQFGSFFAPHHPRGEHPMLQFQRDIDFMSQLDRLGFEEFWCGEHHSTGWEMIGLAQDVPGRQGAGLPGGHEPAAAAEVATAESDS